MNQIKESYFKLFDPLMAAVQASWKSVAIQTTFSIIGAHDSELKAFDGKGEWAW